MTKNENLLVTAMEECAELQQAISKALRFSTENTYPTNVDESTNAQNIITEYYQLIAVMNMIFDSDIITDISEEEKQEIISRKKRKVKLYQSRSRKIGTITD